VNLTSNEQCRAFAMEALLKYPPFPIFERVISQGIDSLPPQCHVFMDADIAAIRTKGKAEFVAFGVGSRACPGKPLAMTFLALLLQHVVAPMKPQNVCPQVGHLYSGRQRDGQDEELLYMGSTIIGMLWRAFKMYLN